ncbi:hypothetical protein GCM10027286_02830 [Virgibacillus ainsalahensis]
MWYEGGQEEIETHKPILNAGDNQFLEGDSLIMGKDEFYEVYKAAPHAKWHVFLLQEVLYVLHSFLIKYLSKFFLI